MTLRGRFVAGCPVVDITIPGVSQPCTAILDTGFNGELMLSASLIEGLGWKLVGSLACTTAGGVGVVDVHEGYVHWMGEKRRVSVLANPMNVCLVGMDLLHDYKIEIHRKAGIVLVH